MTRADGVVLLAEDGFTPEDIARVLNVRHVCEAGLAAVALDSIEHRMLGKIAARYGDVPLLTVDALGKPIPPVVLGDPVSVKVRAFYARDVIRREADRKKPRAFVSFEREAYRTMTFSF